MAGGFRTALWLLGLSAGTATPPPPPPPEEAVSAALSGGWLAHGARWRGWQAPPRRQAEDETADARPLRPLPEDRAVPGVGAGPPAAPLVPLLASATGLPPLDWAPLLTRAVADQARRQALQRAGEEEEMLVLLMLVEEL